MGAPDQGKRLQRGLNVNASGTMPQHDERAVVVTTSFELIETFGRSETGFRGLFHDRQRTGRQPSTRPCRGKSLFGKAPAVRRIKESHGERLDRKSVV